MLHSRQIQRAERLHRDALLEPAVDRRRRRPGVAPLRPLRRRDRLPPDRRRPRQRTARIGPGGNRLPHPLQPRTQAAAGSQRRRPHRPAAGGGQRHQRSTARDAADRLRQTGDAGRLGAAKAHVARQLPQPRAFHAQRNRPEGPMRFDVPRRLWCRRPACKGSRNSSRDGCTTKSSRRGDPPAARRPAGLPQGLVIQRPIERPAGAYRQTAAAMGPRFAGSLVECFPLVAGRLAEGARRHFAGADRLFRAGLDVELPQRDDDAVHAAARRRRPGRHRADERSAQVGLRTPDRLRVQAARLRMVRRRSRPRGPDRLRADAVPRHGEGL